jgi:alpha-amylase/alpha-mannosidase (GH57 family)
MFFRDDGLSDLIGFEYQQWDAVDAAGDFIKHLGNIATFLGDQPGEHVVSVILDGENAWEYYPDNAFHFLGALYERLAASDSVNLLTFSEALDCCPAEPLPKLCAGSWVYGSFSTWIGDPDKNRAWDLLIDAKRVYDRALASKRFGRKQLHRLERQLAICEGSDWFWWFGDYNPADSVSDFDRLYRRQLKQPLRDARRGRARRSRPAGLGGWRGRGEQRDHAPRPCIDYSPHGAPGCCCMSRRSRPDDSTTMRCAGSISCPMPASASGRSCRW